MKNLDNRKIKIKAMFYSGKVLQDIGDVFNISRERVRQILKSMGVDPKDGGRAFKYRQNKALKESIRLNKWLPIYQCTVRELEARIGRDTKFYGKKYALAYYKHRYNAKNRGIGFELSFPEWFDIWVKSGHLDGRGNGGYVMARPTDSGPYKIGNVEIKTQSENIMDRHKNYKGKWGEWNLKNPRPVDRELTKGV